MCKWDGWRRHKNNGSIMQMTLLSRTVHKSNQESGEGKRKTKSTRSDMVNCFIGSGEWTIWTGLDDGMVCSGCEWVDPISGISSLNRLLSTRY